METANAVGVSTTNDIEYHCSAMQSLIKPCPGQRLDTWLYLYNNFRYHKDGRDLIMTIYRCATRSVTNCPAKLYEYNDGTIESQGNHVDTVDFTAIRNLELKADVLGAVQGDVDNLGEMTKELIERHKNLRKTYCDVKTPEAIREMIRKATPKIPIPETLTNLASCMTMSAKGRAIVKGLVTVGTEEALIFSTDEMINRLNTADKIVINRITNVFPDAVNDELLMIHVAEKKDNLTSTFGSVFVYSRQRSVDLYKQTLTHITGLATGLTDVQSVVATADDATVKAIHAVLHPPTIRILWLDFVQSVCELWNSFSMENPPLCIIHSCWALPLYTDEEDIEAGLENITQMVDENITSHPNAAIFFSNFKNQWQHRMNYIVPSTEAFCLSERSEALGRLIGSKLGKSHTVPKLIEAIDYILNHEVTRMNAFVNNDKKAPRDKTVPLLIQADHKKLQENIKLLATRTTIADFFHMSFRPELLHRLDNMILKKYYIQRSLFDIHDTQTWFTDMAADQLELESSRRHKRPLEDEPLDLIDAVSESTGRRGHVTKFAKSITVGATTNYDQNISSHAQVENGHGSGGSAVNSSHLSDDFPSFNEILQGEPESDLWDFFASESMEGITASAHFPVHTPQEDEKLRGDVDLSDSGFQESEEIVHDLDVFHFLMEDADIQTYPFTGFLDISE